MSSDVFAVDLDAGAIVNLPCASDAVMMALISVSGEGTVEALDSHGSVVAQSRLPEPVTNGIRVVSLEGDDIVAVQLSLPQQDTSLLSICWRCIDDGLGGNPPEVEIRYWSGPSIIHTETIGGSAGSVQETTFELRSHHRGAVHGGRRCAG